MSDLEADSSPVSDDRDVADGSEDLSEEYETTAETNAENEEELQLSRQIENVNRLIAECKHREIICLDLSRCGIRTLPDELLDLRHLEVCLHSYISLQLRLFRLFLSPLLVEYACLSFWLRPC